MRAFALLALPSVWAATLRPADSIITTINVTGANCSSHSQSISPNRDVGTIGFDYFIGTEGTKPNCTIEVAFAYTATAGGAATEIGVNVTTHGFADLATGMSATAGQRISATGSLYGKVCQLWSIITRPPAYNNACRATR